MSAVCELTEKKKGGYIIKRIPPEGGWGYLIGIGMALPFVSIACRFSRTQMSPFIPFSFVIYTNNMCV